MPLSLIRPNENGDLYDGTCNKDRVARYALENIETPIHLLYSERSFSRGMVHAAVHDGGHRISAARINLRKHIHAVIKKDHFDLLLKNSEWVKLSTQTQAIGWSFLKDKSF